MLWYETAISRHQPARCVALSLDLCQSSSMPGPMRQALQERVDEILREREALFAPSPWPGGDSTMALLGTARKAAAAAKAVKGALEEHGAFARQGIHAGDVSVAADVGAIKSRVLDVAGHLSRGECCPSGGILVSGTVYRELEGLSKNPLPCRSTSRRCDTEDCYLFPHDMVDVVVPVGPTASDVEKMSPLSELVPKCATPCWGKPLIWHTLAQIRSIGVARIGDVYVAHCQDLASQGLSGMAGDYVEHLLGDPRLPLAGKIKLHGFGPPRSLCQAIAGLPLRSHAFLLHFDDVLLAPKTTGLRDLVDRYFTTIEGSPGFSGLMMSSPGYPVEFGIMLAEPHTSGTGPHEVATFVEKPRHTTLTYSDDWGINQSAFVNMAISVFPCRLQDDLQGGGNDVYAHMSTLVVAGMKFAMELHTGPWDHVDDLRAFMDAARHDTHDRRRGG